MKRIAILCDFDGTVAQDDVGNRLFSTFGDQTVNTDVVTRWKRGGLSSRVVLEEESAAANVSIDDLNAFTLERRLDPYFKDFHDFARKRGMEVVIVSDGLDYYIERMLIQNGLGEIEYFSNQLDIVGTSMRVSFPYYNLLECTECGCCKTSHLKRYRDQGYFIVYVGDGYSDRCPSESADMVFAKGDLLKFCLEKEIRHIKFENFRDVERELLNRVVFATGNE